MFSSTEELAEMVANYAKGYEALLLKSHGTITLGVNLEQAYQGQRYLRTLRKWFSSQKFWVVLSLCLRLRLGSYVVFRAKSIGLNSLKSNFAFSFESIYFHRLSATSCKLNDSSFSLVGIPLKCVGQELTL